MRTLTIISFFGLAIVIYIGFFVTLLTVVPIFAIFWMVKSVIDSKQLIKKGE